jgi:acyl-CoA synthetase (NDP forming)
MRDLSALFDPRSVAVVGASAVDGKWGNWIARGVLTGAHRRDVYLVNAKGGEAFGHPMYPSLREAPGRAELVIVSVPERFVEAAVDEALELGARALVLITAGLGELGSDGRARELEMARRAREAGAVMLGPNCIGLYDAAAELLASSNEYPAGRIGVVSQSGNVSIDLGMQCQRVGLGFSRFASLGNQADLTVADVVADLGRHEGTDLIALYVEDFADGRAFVEAAREASRVKPVLVLSSGRSAAGRRGASSHTGALVSDDAVVDAACRAAGALRVDSPAQLVDAALALLASPLPRGRRVAIIADGGGHGALAGDMVTAEGLDVPEFSDGLVARLESGISVRSGMRNPVDLVTMGDDGMGLFSRACRLALGSGEADIALVTGYLGGYRLYSEAYHRAEAEEAERLAVAQASGGPVIVHSMFASEEGGDDLRAPGLAVYERVEQAARAVAVMVRAAELRGAPEPLPVPPPAPASAVSAGYAEARALLRAAGIRYGEGALVADAAEAVAAADAQGLYPATLKAVDERIVHKSDAGGVRVGLPDAAALRRAADEMTAALSPERLFVEQTADLRDGIELVAGARRDPRFGAVVLVGLGGVLVETLRDTALALAPVDATEAERLLRSLRGAALLDGVRGRPAVDVAAAADAVARLSALAAAHPEIAEIEINPLLVGPTGCVALDARMAPVNGVED